MSATINHKYMINNDKKPRGRPKKDTVLTSAERSRRHRSKSGTVAPKPPKPPRPVPVAPAAPVAPPPPEPTQLCVIDLPPPRRMGDRKQRSDSITAEINAAMADDKPELMPPPNQNVPPEGITDWRAIIASRNRDEWTHGELIQASTLVKCLVKIRQHEAMLDIEDELIYDYLGKLVINPRFSMTDTLHKRVAQLMRSLGISNKRTTSPGRTISGEVVGNDDDADGLLA